MSLTIDNKVPVSLGNRKGLICDIGFDSVYAAGGEDLLPRTIGFQRIDMMILEDKDGYSFEYNRAGKKLIARDKGFVETPVHVKDDDSAASAGVAIYVHIDEVSEQGSDIAHLEFVSPTNADATLTAYNGGPTVYVQDDDNAASGGAALYIDEDATLGSRLLANTGRDCWVDIGGGRFIKITHNATPGTPGVQIYLDEDATNTYDRLRFVSPTDTDGSETTLAEVKASTDLTTLDDIRALVIGV